MSAPEPEKTDQAVVSPAGTLKPGMYVGDSIFACETRVVKNGAGEDRVVFMVEHRHGSFALPMPPATAEQIFHNSLQVARAAQGKPAEGLVVAQTIPKPAPRGQYL